MLESEGCIYMRSLAADAPLAILGSAISVALSVATGMFVGVFTAGALLLCMLASWNGFLLWRTYCTRRNWVIAITPGTCLVRILRHLGPQQACSTEPSVLWLEASEVDSLSIEMIEIVWSSIRRTALPCLLIKPRYPAAEASHLIEESGLFIEYSCDSPTQRLASWHSEGLLIPWTYCHPKLDDYLRNISACHCAFLIQAPHPLSLDLRDFVLWSDAEQRATLRRLKQLGFGQACVMLLKRRMRMSRIDAVTLMDSL